MNEATTSPADGVASPEVTAQKAIEVILIDDHPIFLEGASAVLKAQPDFQLLAKVSNTEKATQYLEEHPSAVLVVDFMLEEGNCLSSIRAWKRAFPNSKSLVVSMLCDPVSVEQSMEAGAQGYVTKQEAAEQLVHAVKEIASGKTYISPSAAQARDNWAATGDENTPQEAGRLTRREQQVLARIGEGQETRDIASALGVSRKTVETHKENLKRKLRCASQTALARRAAIWSLGRFGSPNA